MQGNFGAFKRNNFIVGQRLSPLCVFYDSANIKVKLGSKLLADGSDFLENWIGSH